MVDANNEVKRADEVRLQSVISNVKRWDAISAAKARGDISTVRKYATVKGWEESPEGKIAVSEAKVEAKEVIEAKPPEVVKKEIEARKLEVTEAKKLAIPTPERLGITVVEPYKPPTKEEIEARKRLEFERAPFEVIKEKVKTPIEKAKAKIEGAYRTVRELYFPGASLVRAKLGKFTSFHRTGLKTYERNLSRFEGEVKEFEKRYIDKELSEKEYNIAVRKQDELREKSKGLEKDRGDLVYYQGEIEKLGKEYKIRVATPPIPGISGKILTHLSIGAITAPITAAAFVTTAITEPGKIIRGVYEMPKAIAEKPLELIPEMVGAAIVYGAGIGGVKAAVGKLRAPKYIEMKPGISHSISVSKATKIGKNLWKTEGTIVTKLKHPKTGKTIETIRTQTISDTITSPTKSGAIKALSKSWATSLKTSNIKLITGKTPKIKLKVSLTKARGEMTLSPTEATKLYRGRGELVIREMGEWGITAVPKKVISRIRLRPRKRFEALADVWAKELGVRAKVKAVVTPKELIAIRGREYIYGYKALVDIYGKKKAVAIIKAREAGIAKAFVPEELFVKFKKPLKPPVLRARLPPEPIIKPTEVSAMQLQKLVGGMPEKVVAEISAKAITKGIGEILIRKAKPIVIPKVSPALRTIQVISPTIAAIEIPKLREEERLREIALSRLGLGIVTMPRERLKYIQQVGTGLAQISGIRQIPVPRLVRPPRIISPVIPKVPVLPAIPPPPIVPPPTLVYYKKEVEAEERRIKAQGLKLRKQQRAYQASVGAAVLGLTIPKVKAKKLAKAEFTGLELRPVVTDDYSYAKQLQGMQSNLLFPSRATERKRSPRKQVRMLQAQQIALVEPARGGRKKHRKKIKKQYEKELRRIKLYRSKKIQKKALKKGKLKKRKTRRKTIIDRVNALFR